ncbi:MAG TPA: cytochrome c [Burkholderiales bacterium]|jgi:cytochrome c|nr:cytochrome c [Burkholderiales bacterium]
MFAPKHLILAACTACTLTITPTLAQQHYNLGRPATPAEIAGWDIDVKADGTGLPKGRGTVAAGAAIFAEKCAACHGAKGEGSVANKLAGGAGTLNTAGALKTVGSFWPYPTTLFDYIRRAMPHNAPQSLKADEVYSLTAFILNVNGVIDAKAEMNQTTLPKVQMPNRGGFKQVVD